MSERETKSDSFSKWEEELVKGCNMGRLTINKVGGNETCPNTPTILVQVCCHQCNSCLDCYTAFVSRLGHNKYGMNCKNCETVYMRVDKLIKATPL